MQLRLLYPYFLAILVLLPLVVLWLRRTPRRLSPGRRRFLIALRLAVLILLVGALVRLSLTQAYQRANVVFLLDLSQSIATTVRQQALDFMQAMVAQKRPQDSVEKATAAAHLDVPGEGDGRDNRTPPSAP